MMLIYQPKLRIDVAPCFHLECFFQQPINLWLEFYITTTYVTICPYIKRISKQKICLRIRNKTKHSFDQKLRSITKRI
jgi:hypothetical protein